jgi:NAD(P)H-hydrate epimerase
MGPGHLPELLEQAMASDAAVIGPGLSSDPESIQLAREFIISAEAPLVIDGDALTALAGREELCREREYPTCLTPHSGEMARLLGSSVKEVEARRIETALEAAERYGAAVVLKGAHSIIAGPDGSAWINLTGNSGMGTAGSGDVLAGLTGSLFCRFPAGTSAAEVLKLAVHLHGLAGDLAAGELGEDGVTASDILRHLPFALSVYGEKIQADPFSGRITPI